MTSAQRFLTAFDAIEKCLRKIAKTSADASFATTLAQAASRSGIARTLQADLRQYAALRNAIVHNHRGDKVIAEPHRDIVADIERIRDLLLHPPAVDPLFLKSVTSVGPDSPLAEVVKILHDEQISQVPVVLEKTFIDLITTKTIARWLGANIEEDLFSLRETKARDVVRHNEGSDSHRFISRRESIVRVLELFHECEREGKKLQALFVTEHGRANEALLGVITIGDLPLIFRVLGM